MNAHKHETRGKTSKEDFLQLKSMKNIENSSQLSDTMAVCQAFAAGDSVLYV